MKLPRLIAIAGLASLAAACVAPPPPPPPVQLSAVLTGSQEVPPTASPASGQASVQYDRTTQRMTYTIAYNGLTGPLQQAHFHGPALSGANAGVMVPLGVTHSPLTGSAVLTPALANELLAGRLYVNLHTPAFPAGEIRGQVVQGVASVVTPAPVVVAPAQVIQPAPVVVAPGTTTTTTVISPGMVARDQVVLSTTRNADGSTTVVSRNPDGSITTTTYR